MMKLISNTPFDITEYCGNLMVTYLAEDKALAQPVLTALKGKGYEYIENEVGVQTILKSGYLPGSQQLLNSCGCYILCVSENLQKPENRVLRNCIFYQIGFLEARRSQSVLLYIPDGAAKTAMSGTPIHNASGGSSVESILTALGPNDERFRTIVMQNNFYEDENLNILTQDRIEYRRMIVSMDITEEDFREAYQKFKDRINNDRMTEQEFINALQYNMTCGARLLSFGTENKLTTHLYPYASEQKCRNTMDFPTNFACAHSYKDDPDKRDTIKGIYTLEYILPIHKLMGVNFKLFIRATKDMTTGILETLFRSNFREGNDLHINGKTMYFSLHFPNAEEFPFDQSLNIGNLADFLYPQ